MHACCIIYSIFIWEIQDLKFHVCFVQRRNVHAWDARSDKPTFRTESKLKLELPRGTVLETELVEEREGEVCAMRILLFSLLFTERLCRSRFRHSLSDGPSRCSRRLFLLNMHKMLVDILPFPNTRLACNKYTNNFILHCASIDVADPLDTVN